mgnify:CR=1 FL=1
MGFGLLLCSYFLLSFMSVAIGDYCFATYILAAMVGIKAIGGLKDYNPRFTWLYPCLAVYGLLSMFYAARVLDDLFLWNLPIHDGIAQTLAEWIRFAAELCFTLIALWSSAELAASVGVEMPIAQAAYQVLYQGRPPQEVVTELMHRKKSHEVEEGWI